MKARGVKHTTCAIDTFNSFYLVMLRMVLSFTVLRDTCATGILNWICETRWFQSIQFFKTIYVKVARPRGFEPLTFASGGFCSVSKLHICKAFSFEI